MSNSRLSTELALGLAGVALVASAMTLLGSQLGQPGVTVFGLGFLIVAAVVPSLQRLRRFAMAAVGGAVAFGVALMTTDSMAVLVVLTVAFVIAALVGQIVGSRLHGLDEAVESALYGLRARPLANALPELQSELARSRRYDRPLSLMVVRPESFIDRTSDGASGWLRLTSLLDDAIRETDLLLQSTGRFVIVSPETDAEELEVVRRRVTQLMKVNGITARVGVASFPTDGSSLDTLLATAQAGAARRQEKMDIA